jgi:hypothetical protein
MHKIKPTYHFKEIGLTCQLKVYAKVPEVKDGQTQILPFQLMIGKCLSA